jgi:WD40 repeat protein
MAACWQVPGGIMPSGCGTQPPAPVSRSCGTFLQGVLVWDVTKRDPRWVGRAHVTWIRRVAWSPDETRLASGGGSQGQGDGGELVVWDAHSGERHPAWHPLRGRGNAGNSALAGHPGVVSALSWAPSGELVLSGGSDGRVRWWEVQSGQCMRVREAHQGTVQALKVSPDGSVLASCGDDGVIALWDLQSGEPLHTLRRDRPYERLDITGIRGLTQAQKATLRALGAVEDEA